MPLYFLKIFRKKRRGEEIFPDEIFLDSKNIPGFNIERFEGRIEAPLGRNVFFWLRALILLLLAALFARVFFLEAVRGEEFFLRSERNLFKKEFLIPNRGIIYDRKGVKLAYNGAASREYIRDGGFGHILGFVGLPSKKDVSKRELPLNLAIGKAGAEYAYDEVLSGKTGIRLVESDSLGRIVSEIIQKEPQDGKSIKLSIDAEVQARLFRVIREMVYERKYTAGSGVIMDVRNGEILALVNYPEYDPQILSAGKERKKIEEYINDRRKPFLNRAISGLYAPGSIVKPFVAIAALNEGIISPDKKLYSSGSISIPNPYFPDKKSVFYDWKAHGWVDMRQAIAVSSDIYFYIIGGGFEGQRGLGIGKLSQYARKFGFGEKTGIEIPGEKSGTVPSPEVKARLAKGDIWRLGDTYISSIGQGYFEVTPIQAAVFASALANNGRILVPRVLFSKEKNFAIVKRDLSKEIPLEYFQVVKEGMRQAVLDGTVSVLNIPGIEIAAKTGTAEVGISKSLINSWVIGFFPYRHPRWAFAIVLEKGPRGTLIGAANAARRFFEWLIENNPEYLNP